MCRAYQDLCLPPEASNQAVLRTAIRRLHPDTLAVRNWRASATTAICSALTKPRSAWRGSPEPSSGKTDLLAATKPTFLLRPASKPGVFTYGVPHGRLLHPLLLPP